VNSIQDYVLVGRLVMQYKALLDVRRSGTDTVQ